MTKIRYIVDYDDEAVFEECNGESRPLTEDEYAKNQYIEDGEPISYPDYLAYYGNPDRHVYLYVRREDKCPHCSIWQAGGALYRIDFMDDGKEASYIGTYTLDQLPEYLREVASDLESPEEVKA